MKTLTMKNKIYRQGISNNDDFLAFPSLEENKQKIINNDNEKGKTGLDNRRTMGSSTLRNLVGERSESDRIYQAISEASANDRGDFGSPERDRRKSWDKERFLGKLEVLSKANGMWIDDITSITKSRLGGGFENEVHLSKDNRTVIKVNNFAFLNDDASYEYVRDINYFVDRLLSHNELFHNVAYKIIGFTENSKGEVSIVLEQPYVNDAEYAEMRNIYIWLRDHGFNPARLTNGMEGFTNGKYEISDVKPANVLVDNEGNLRFIDTDINSVG
jgi:hypothetical protein